MSWSSAINDAKRAMRILRAGTHTGNEAELESASKAIAEAVVTLPPWAGVEIVLTYMAMPAEVRTNGIIRRALAAGKTVGIPRIAHSEIRFHVYDGDRSALTMHRYGIPEPASTWPEIEMEADDGGVADEGHLPLPRNRRVLVIVPGLAFDMTCNRLGRGGGFYDRFLTRYRQSLFAVGICMDSQLCDHVPNESHDVRMDWVVSERRILDSQGDQL